MRQNDGADPVASEHRIMRVILPCLIRFALAAVFAMPASAAPAQTYPARPIRLLVSFPPGGASDLVARTLGQPLGARLGQPVVVENSGFIALARDARPPLFYASIGNGSEHHLAMELLKQQAGIDLVHVPYRGGGPAAIGVMAGDVAAMFGGGSVAPLIQGGKLKGLAVSGQRRSRLLPDLPPIADVYPGYEVTIWQGLFAPVGTPLAIVARLREEVNAILAQSEVVDKLAAAGSGDPYVTTLADFVARIRSDHARYGKLIKDIGLAVD